MNTTRHRDQVLDLARRAVNLGMTLEALTKGLKPEYIEEMAQAYHKALAKKQAADEAKMVPA